MLCLALLAAAPAAVPFVLGPDSAAGTFEIQCSVSVGTAAVAAGVLAAFEIAEPATFSASVEPAAVVA